MKDLVSRLSADDLHVLWTAMAGLCGNVLGNRALTAEQWERAEVLFEMLDEAEQERSNQ